MRERRDLTGAMMMDDQLISQCLAPCRSDAPVGQEVRQLPAYEAVRVEVDKLDDPRSAPPDWGLVEGNGVALLRERGKDLLVACYLAWARYERGGLLGLAEGLALVHRLLATFGATMYPSRPHARRSALAWLHARLESIAATNHDISEGTARALASILGDLQTAAIELLGEGAPSFEQVGRRLRVAKAVPELPAAGPRLHPTSGCPAPSGASGPSRKVEAEPKDDRDRELLTLALDTPVQRRVCLARTAHLLRTLAARCLEEDLADPRPYRLVRIAGSLLWEAAPAANERGRTELDPPSPRRLRELHNAHEAGAARDVVTISESLLAQQPLWLDGHWFTAQALTALGGSYDAARAVVSREGRILFARLPELATLTFADGSALGSAETRAWLALREPSATPPDPCFPERLARAAGGSMSALIARVIADDGDARGAFERAVRASRSPRRAFQLRLALARQLEVARQIAAAARIYAGLERDLDAYRIDLWDPELARAVVLGLSRTLPTLAPEAAAQLDVARVSARAAQLAPTMCL